MRTTPIFNNFDLYIGPKIGDTYPLTVLYSPAGETSVPIELAIDHNDQALLYWLAGLQCGHLAHDDLLAFGRRLTSYLLPPGPVRDLYQRSLGVLQARQERLRLRLRISPPELAALPWEYAYNDDIADFFALNPHTVLVRYHGQPTPPRSIASYTPVPILLLIANPSRPGVPALNVITEINNLVKALGSLLDDRQVSIALLYSGPAQERQALASLTLEHTGLQLLPDPASVDALRTNLRQGYRVIHYVGHGVFDEQRGGALLMTDELGQERLVNAQTLARELRGSSTGVVVLNACETAMEGTGQLFMGLASNLIRADVPAVVAMQYAIKDRSAVSFSQAFYKALADGWPLDAAITEGRKAIAAQSQGENLDWGIPVLFMRAQDGVIWKEEAKTMEQQARASKAIAESGRSGGVDFHGSADIKGSVSGRDTTIYGGQVIGRQTTGVTAVELAEITRLLTVVKQQIETIDAPDSKKIVGREFVDQLGKELTKTAEAPDASTIKVAGEWLLKNLPALAGTLASLFLNPLVGKVVGAAGDIAAEWVKQQFSSAE